MVFTFTLGELIAWLVGICTLFGAIAGAVIWMYSTFITRVEGAKIESAVQSILELFKQVLDEKLGRLHARLDGMRKTARATGPKKRRFVAQRG